MAENELFTSYPGCVEKVDGLVDYAGHGYSDESVSYAAPQLTTHSGSYLSHYDNHVYSTQPNFEVLYPVIADVHQGTTYYYYPHIYHDNYYVPITYNYPVLEDGHEPRPVPSSAGIQDDTPDPSSGESTLSEDEVDPDFLYEKLSSLTIQEVKSNMERGYFYRKSSLYTRVLKGYEKKKKRLEKLKCGWDPFLLTIPEDRERKKAFDLKKYFFDDTLSFPRSNEIPYEADGEKYFLYQMLGSLKLKNLRRDMKKNYNKGMKKLYREVCKGHTKRKTQLKELNWRRHRLGSISEENESDSTEMEVDEILEKSDFKNEPSVASPVRVGDVEVPEEVVEMKKKKKRFKRIREFFSNHFSSRRHDQIDMETTAQILTYFYERSEKQFRFLRTFKGLY